MLHVLWNHQIVSTAAIPSNIHSHQQCISILIFHISINMSYFPSCSVINIQNITVNMSGNSLILISLMTNFVAHLFMHLFVLVCILWRNNYSNSLPIFQLTCPFVTELFFVYSTYWILIRYKSCKYFLQNYKLYILTVILMLLFSYKLIHVRFFI